MNSNDIKDLDTKLKNDFTKAKKVLSESFDLQEAINSIKDFIQAMEWYGYDVDLEEIFSDDFLFS